VNELEDLLVRTLRDPARALPAPAEPLPAIRARARAQRRHAALGVAALVLVTVAALVVPMSLRRADPLPPASGHSLLDWAPRGPLAGDTALVAEAERTWREGGTRRPADAVSLLWAGPIGGERTVLLQGRDGAGTALVALTAGDPQRVVRVDLLTDPGTAGVRLAVGNATFLLMRPDAASVYVLEEWGSTGWAETVPADGVVPDAVGYKVRQYVARDASGQILGEGTVARDGSLPLVVGPVRQAAPTWRHARLIPLPIAGEIGRQVVPRLDEAGAAGPVEVAALEGGFGGKPAELYTDAARSWLYEVRRGGRTWLASGVLDLRPPPPQDPVQSFDPLQCLRLTEITGRVAATDALVTRCWLPGSRAGVVLVHVADGVRLTGMTLAAARPGERTWRYSGEPVGSGLAQAFGTDFPTGAGRVTLVDASGKPLPPVEVPPYS
jgi:hypothetical protein